MSYGQPARRTVMYTQKQINAGQRKINGALCYVDWEVIKVLDALIKALTDKKVLSRKELRDANKAFKKAYYTSPKVAEIKPPGCDPNFFASIKAVKDAA
jgi:hypothetical protein